MRLSDIKDTSPRREHGDIESLKLSIAQVGLINPLTIDSQGNLLAGRRRFQALMELYGPEYEIEATVLPVNGDQLKAFRIAIDENLKRKNLTDPEVAAAFKDYTELQIKLLGQRLPGGSGGKHVESVVRNANNAKVSEGWSLRQSAKEWQISPSTAHMAIQIATAIERTPALAALPNGKAILRAVKTRARQAERERDAVEVEGKELPLNKQYATIAIDPPWDWGDEGDVDQLGRAKPTYATMPLSEIAELPVAALSLPDAHIYLWITNRSLPKGFGLLEIWGFRYITCLTWVKGGAYGMGNYFRGSTEHVLFGVKGSLPLLVHDLPTHFNASRPGPHSGKPDEFFSLVERASPGPRLEMFARKKREGWDVWGNL